MNDMLWPWIYGVPRNRHLTVGTPSDVAFRLPLFTPGNITKEAKTMTHDMVVNRGAAYKANVANKSAAAAIKEDDEWQVS
ncbi:hypothetical protein DID88_007983 [Monilinia fructigena]|uniref:Uncharacterized protein n=1 Tax=Monilinia fructigena TaxID=38457 RepID=A0A395J4J5_9HELO|nr:hypothetical protein DID88_007983 [Monilinia fructigena]